jgi:hypothetical protein
MSAAGPPQGGAGHRADSKDNGVFRPKRVRLRRNAFMDEGGAQAVTAQKLPVKCLIPCFYGHMPFAEIYFQYSAVISEHIFSPPAFSISPDQLFPDISGAMIIIDVGRESQQKT